MTNPEEPKKPEEALSPPDTQDRQLSYEAARRCLIAVHTLSKDDVRTLYGFAGLKMLRIRSVVFSADPEDLVHEAIKRTLTGQRQWSEEEPDFLKHLKQCISSIGNEMAKRAYLEQEAIQEFERRRSMLERDPLYASELLDETRIRLRDAIARMVFDQLLQGNRRADICRALNMPFDVYDAARKRISRCLFALSAELAAREQHRKSYNEQETPGGQHV